MLVTVTGASGHVGANLVRTLLGHGDAVRALVQQDEAPLAGLDVDLRRVDVTDREAVRDALRGSEVVFHLAAHISIRGHRDEALLQRTNVEGTRHVVEACLGHDVQRLVHFSSIHAIRGDQNGTPVCEDTPLAIEPDCPCYDRSKATGERVVLDAVDRGLDAVIVNPTSIVGPYDFKPSAQGRALLTMVCRRWLPMVQAGYDWVDVRDVVRGALAALERGRTGERYILGSQRLTFAQIAAHIAEATGLRVPRLALPLWTGYLGVPFARLWSALTGARQLLTVESIRILTRHHTVCCDKARAELDYAPRPFGETMADTFAWYRDAGLLPPRLVRAAALPSTLGH